MTSAPLWFRRALDAPRSEHAVLVDDANIVYTHWPGTTTNTIVLIHGGSAHRHWWDHVAPGLISGGQVIALDLSGHGDSDRRSHYSLSCWSQEVVAVLAASRARGPATIIGHSMGGFVAHAMGQEFGSELRAVVTVDAAVVDPSSEQLERRARYASATLRRYDTVGQAVARFRPVPAQESNLPFVLAHIAQHSLRDLPGGSFTWSFDPAAYRCPPPRPADIEAATVPTTLVRPEQGLLTSELAQALLDRLGPKANLVEIPRAGHHVMLDQPQALIRVLDALVAAGS